MLNVQYLGPYHQLKPLLELDPPDTLEKLEALTNSYSNSNALRTALEEAYDLQEYFP